MEEEHLDELWVNKFKEDEMPYRQFYKEKTVAVDIICIYVNAKQEVVSIVKDKHHLLDEKGIISKENLLQLIQTNKRHNGVDYTAGSIAKYNFTIEPDEVISMDTIDAKRYFHSQKYYGNVLFEDSIALFQDVNALFLIFIEKNARARLTKHVRFHTPVRQTRRKKK